MNIQIFGTNKSFDTKKAQRWFKERGIKFQMIDMKEKGMSRGEFDNVCRAVGGGRSSSMKAQRTRIRWRCCNGWTKASRQTSCSRTSSSSASPLYAMAGWPPWATAPSMGEVGVSAFIIRRLRP